MKIQAILWDESKHGAARAQKATVTLQRPCECGCDNREHPDAVGYIIMRGEGRGATLLINDEKLFKAIARGLKKD